MCYPFPAAKQVRHARKLLKANKLPEAQRARNQARRPGIENRTRPLLRVMTPLRGQFIWLHHGRAGNLQTAFEMARLVREDAWRDEGLKRWAAQLLINSGLDSHSDESAILNVVFHYVQGVKYIADAGGDFDAIASARETIANGYGDCDDLAVLLATLLALLGFTPSFVLAKYNADGNGFDHIYVEVETPRGDHVVLDPTMRRHGIGWENPHALDRLIFPIFGAQGTFNALGDALQVATQGAAIGLSFVPVVGPIVAGLLGPIVGLFDKSKQKAEEKAREQTYLQVVDAIHGLQAQLDACQLTSREAAEKARAMLMQFYSWCDSNLSSKVAKTCRNYDAKGEFTGYIATMEKEPGCAPATTGAPVAAGSVSDGGLSGLSMSLPAALLVLGGGFLVLKALKG